MEYEELRSAVAAKMPEEFKTGIVERKYYDTPFSNYELNFNPYVRKGEILPDHLELESKEDGQIYSFGNKGQEWFFESLLRIDANNLQHLLPALFIFTFLSEYRIARGRFSTIDNLWEILGDKNGSNLYEMAKTELENARIRLPYPSTKHFLRLSSDAFDKLSKLRYKNQEELREILSSPDKFAELIVFAISSCTEEYKYIYWSYPKSEYDRAFKTYQNAVYSFQDELLQAIKSNKENSGVNRD